MLNETLLSPKPHEIKNNPSNAFEYSADIHVKRILYTAATNIEILSPQVCEARAQRKGNIAKQKMQLYHIASEKRNTRGSVRENAAAHGLQAWNLSLYFRERARALKLPAHACPACMKYSTTLSHGVTHVCVVYISIYSYTHCYAERNEIAEITYTF